MIHSHTLTGTTYVGHMNTLTVRNMQWDLGKPECAVTYSSRLGQLIFSVMEGPFPYQLSEKTTTLVIVLYVTNVAVLPTQHPTVLRISRLIEIIYNCRAI